MAIGEDGKELKVGSIKWVWDDEEKVAEYLKRCEAAKEEIKAKPSGEKFIIFYMKKRYNSSYSTKVQITKILYKQSVKKFRQDGFVDYKPHYLTVKRGKIKTSNFEEIAFLDMHKEFFRETDRPLTPLEIEKQKAMRLERELAILRAEKENPETESKPKEEKVKDESTRAKGKT